MLVSLIEQYHHSITEHQEVITNNSNHCLETTNTNFTYKINLVKGIKWLIATLLLLTLTIGFNKIMLKELNKDGKNMNQHFSNSSQVHFITSYIPEILTGHEHFIGRKKVLQQIEQHFTKDNIVVITGPAGIGKSTCAIEFGKRYKKQHIVRYFNTEFKTKIDQQYRELAQELNISLDQQSQNVVMQLVNSRLSSLTTKILFIFDNLDLYDDAKEYLINLPTNVYVIITSRQPRLISHIQHVVLEEFSFQEAEVYLKNSLYNRNLTTDLIQQLVKNNGTLPYDLKCVAAYLLDNPSIDNQTAINKTKIKDTLFKEFIVNSNPTKQQAWKILQYASHLDPDFINIEIVKKLFPTQIKLSSNALKKLESLSLVSTINNQNDQAGFRIHRNLQINIQNSAKNHKEYSINKQNLIDHLLNVIDQLFPEVTFNPTEKWIAASSFQPHVEKLLKTKNIALTSKKPQIHLTNLYYKLARYYSAININYLQALKYAKIALDLRSNLYKTNNSDLANAYNDIGVIYRKIGKPQQGLKYLKHGLKIRKYLYKGDHDALANSYHTIGSAYNQNGETEKGLKYAHMALEMNKRLYYGNHYEIGCSLNLVGISYLDLGDIKKSLEYFKEGLKMFTELKPTHYERIASFQSNIAYNYNKLGNYPEALKYATFAVELFNKIYPDGHPKAIYALDDLGDSLIRTNNIDMALIHLHQALDLSEKFDMNKHCITAFVLNDLGRGYLKKGIYTTALEYGARAVNLRQELYDNVKHHHELAESLHNLAEINVALGNKNNGLQLYKDALAMYVALSLEHLPEVDEIKQKIKDLASISRSEV